MCNDDLAALLDSLERWYPRPFLDALAALGADANLTGDDDDA